MNKIIAKKNLNMVLLIVMSLIFVAVLVAVIIHGVDKMSSVDNFHVAGEFISMLLSIVIFWGILTMKSSSEKEKRFFIIFVMLTYISISMDIISRLNDGTPRLRDSLFILNICVYVFEVLAIIFAFKFIVCQIEPFSKGFKRFAIIVETLMYASLAARMVMCALGYYFYIDADGFYQLSNYYFVSRLSSLVLAAVIFSIIIGSDLKVKRKIGLISFPVFYTTAQVISMLDDRFDLELIMTIWAVVFIFCLRFMELRDDTRWLGDQFKTYLAKDVVEEMLSSKVNNTTKSDKMNLSILFVGIADFAKIIKDMKPNEIMIMYNHFLDVVIDACDRNKGTVIELTSNGLICVYGVAESHENHVDNAVNTALMIKNSMRQVKEWNLNNNFPEFDANCGICTGEVFIGYIGSPHHSRFSAISTEINLCSRLAGIAEAGEIVVSSNIVKNYSGELGVYEPDSIKVKGFDEMISIFRLGDEKDD